MSFSPEELRKRSEAFGLAWQSFVATPNPDRLLEFAVSISSFTEFLHSKGLSGLHQISRNVEQQVLSMFEDGGDTSAPQTTLNELDVLVSKLDLKVSDFISRSNLPIAERRSEYGALTAIDTSPSHRILLIGRAFQPWQDFMLQLGYFGNDAEFHDALEFPANTTQPATVLFDAAGDPSGVERMGIALEPEADYERRPDGGGGCEDPRITFVEPLGRYVMTYTAFSPRGPRIALAASQCASAGRVWPSPHAPRDCTRVTLG